MLPLLPPAQEGSTRITAPRGGREKGPAAPSSAHPGGRVSPAPPRQAQQHIITWEASLCPRERSPLDDRRGRGDEAGWPRGVARGGGDLSVLDVRSGSVGDVLHGALALYTLIAGAHRLIAVDDMAGVLRVLDARTGAVLRSLPIGVLSRWIHTLAA